MSRHPLSDTADRVNRATHTARSIAAQWPDDTLLFATSANAVETAGRGPVGWSLRRFLQLRAVLVITDQHVAVVNQKSSAFLLFWWVFAAFSAVRLVTSGSPMLVVALPAAVMFSLQRRPFLRTYDLGEIEHIELGSVRGMAGSADLLSLTAGGRTLHMGLARSPGPEILAMLRGERPS